MTWFQALSQREKVLILMVLPFAAIAAAYQFIWVPVQASRAQYVEEIATYRLISDTAALARQANGQALPVQAVNPPTEPIATRITQLAEAAGISLRRIEPDDGGMRVTLSDTQFSSLVLWLAEMEETKSVTVAAIEIDRRPEPGIVSARILLKDL